MELPELIIKLGGTATTTELLRMFGRPAIRHALGDGSIVRVARGHYALPGGPEALAAARRVGGVMSHLSAAQHWGWKIKLPPELPVVTVPRNRKLTGPQRAGIDIRWFNLHPDDIRDGVTSRLRTVGDCSRSERLDAALAVADSAVRSGDVTQPRSGWRRSRGRVPVVPRRCGWPTLLTGGRQTRSSRCCAPSAWRFPGCWSSPRYG